MAKLRMTVELEYDEDEVSDALSWFLDDARYPHNDLMLYCGFMDADLGQVRIIDSVEVTT